MTERNINLIKAGEWIQGSEAFGEGQTLRYWLKVFEIGSEYGINQGKISKLEIRLDDETLANYDRGWDTLPTDEIRPFYESLLAQYN